MWCINQFKQLREIAWIQSHKVRAPVANILGLADMLKNSDQHEREAQMDEMLQMILLFC
jgi:light-regulated signal transduction histidine kinase (bacteriophytochrome)